jgi:hypothetical protein
MANTTKTQVNSNSQNPSDSKDQMFQDKIYDIRERTFRFAQRILEIADLISERLRKFDFGNIGIWELLGSIWVLDLGFGSGISDSWRFGTLGA